MSDSPFSRSARSMRRQPIGLIPLASALLGALFLSGCMGAAQATSSPGLPAGVPASEKVPVAQTEDPASKAAGGSGMPIPGAGGGTVAYRDAPNDPSGASSGGSGMPIPKF